VVTEGLFEEATFKLRPEGLKKETGEDRRENSIPTKGRHKAPSWEIA
jgi:hypothetical protein